MSDVSGIPYMGSQGLGNFFAPPFGGGGMNMSAGQISSPYMPEIANNQNVVNNLFASGGGFGKQTDYYSQLGANYSAAGMSPYGVFSDTGGPASGGGISYQGGAFNAPPASINNDAWNQSVEGPNWGGGSGFSSGSFGGFGGGGSTPAIDWSNLFSGSGGGGGLGSSGFNAGNLQNWAGNWNTPSIDPYPGMSMPGGLNAPMTMPQQQPLDYGSLFGRGAGGMGSAATADPYPAMSMPGGLNSPMDAPMAGAPPATADWSTLFGDSGSGMTMPGGLNSPMTIPETQAPAYDYGSLFGKGTSGTPDGTRTYDFAPMFEGGGGGFGAGGGDTSGTGDVEARSFGGNAFSYDPYSSGAQEASSGTSADALAEQARARLAGLMGSGDTAPLELGVSPREAAVPDLPAGAEVPLPAARPEGADAPRPPENIPPAPPVERPAPLPEGASRPPAGIRTPFGTTLPTMEMRPGITVQGVAPRLVAAVQGGATFLPPGYHVEVVSGVRNSPTSSQGYHRSGNAIDVQIIGPDGPIPHQGADDSGMYTLLARGVKTWTTQNDPATAAQLGYGGAFGTLIGGGGVPDLMHYDLGGSRGNMRPEVQFGRLTPLTTAEQNAMPAYIPLLGANQVPLDAPNARTSAPSIPLPRDRPADASAPNASAAPLRFSEAGGSMGGELPTPGAFTPYADFRQSADFENRTAEPSPRDQLAALQANYEPGPEVAPTPLGTALGLEDIGRPEPEVASTPLGTALGLEDIGRDFQRPASDAADLPLSPSRPAEQASPEMSQEDLQQVLSGLALNAFPGEVGRGGYLNNPAGGADNVAVPPEQTLPEVSRLAPQRSGYADTIRDDPNKSLQLAARLYSEEQNNPVTRQAILEAMLNRLQATGQDPLNLAYYPKDTKQYNDALTKLSNNNDLLSQIYREMEGPFGGSNVSNFATDWASDLPKYKLATIMRQYATPTYTSPSNEQFFRKDFSTNTGSQHDTGPGDAVKNQRWYESVSSPVPR